MSPYLPNTHTPPISQAALKAVHEALTQARLAWDTEVRSARDEGREARQAIGDEWVNASVRWQELIGCRPTNAGGD